MHSGRGCVLVGDEGRALQLYELLLPHADDNAVSYTQQPFGPVALRLGKLAALLGRWKETDRHFATALARCELLGARAIRTRVLFEHASALAARGEPADQGRLNVMLEEAADLCAELGMAGISERVSRPFAMTSSAQPSAMEGVFRREGEFWTIVYEGQTFRVRDVKGLRYIASLLASPGRQVHVLELASAVAGQPVESRARLVETESRRLVAVRRHSGARRAGQGGVRPPARGARRGARAGARLGRCGARSPRLSDEIDLLTQELARAVGLRGP